MAREAGFSIISIGINDILCKLTLNKDTKRNIKLFHVRVGYFGAAAAL